MTPEQGAFLLEFIFLPFYTAEHPVTKAVIAAIPPDNADYRPDSIVRNAIDLAWHIVVAEDRFMNAVAAGGFTFDNASRPEAIRTPADIVAWYSERFADNIERLKTTSVDALVVPVDFRGLFTFPAVVFLQSGIRSHRLEFARKRVCVVRRPACWNGGREPSGPPHAARQGGS